MAKRKQKDKFAEFHASFDLDSSMTTDEIIKDGLRILSAHLRDYQIEACRHGIERIMKSTNPMLIVLPTGSGKSWVLVGLSYLIRRIVHKTNGSIKKVLMICPSPTLAQQNANKLFEAKFKASVYCNKLKSKSTEHDFIIGTPISLVNSVGALADLKEDFAAVFVDEAHSHTDSIKTIITQLKERNPNLREIGLTATPYTIPNGYIFQQNTFKNRDPLNHLQTRNPYYAELIYEKNANDLIENRFLTPITFSPIKLSYDISGLKKDSNGNWTAASTRAVFIKDKHQFTTRVIEDVKQKMKGRKAILIFAQNIEHANILKEYFEPDEAGITHSKIDDAVRDKHIANFVAGELRYLINVDSLTKGFDAPVCDGIILLRATESLALFMQIIGRGMRLTNIKGHKKRDCLVVDYAGNLARHCPTGDLFNDEEKTFFSDKKGGVFGEREIISVKCPKCKFENQFQKLLLPEVYISDKYGYIVNQLTGDYVMSRGTKPYPVSSHHGMRCGNFIKVKGKDRLERCSYLWSNNTCSFCGRLNASRSSFCADCHAPAQDRLEAVSFGAENYIGYLENHKGSRYAKILDLSWRLQSLKTGHTFITLKLKVREAPFRLSRFVREICEPGEYELKISLSPHSKKKAAIKQWEVFCLFWLGKITNDVNDFLIDIQAHATAVILYKEDIDDKTIFRIEKFIGQAASQIHEQPQVKIIQAQASA